MIVGNCQWLFHKDINFGSIAYLVEPNSCYESAAIWGGFGNEISSARALPPDLEGTDAIVLFEDAFFNGRMLVLYDSDSNLVNDDFNDKLSSFIVIGGFWTLFYHTEYRTSGGTFTAGNYQVFPSNVLDEEVSSVRKNCMNTQPFLRPAMVSSKNLTVLQCLLTLYTHCSHTLH